MPQKRTIPKTCRECGKSFLCTERQDRIGGGKYCSSPCRAIGAGKTRTGPGNVSWKGGLLVGTCEQCGTPFRYRPHHLTRGRAKYCSRICADIARRHEPYPEDRGYTTLCIIWPGGKTGDGYANGRMHRAMYEATYGLVSDGMELDHLCRQRDCINPDHLEEVTHTENIRRSAATKLNWDKVRDIRRLYAQGASQHILAERFGVGKSQIQHIVHLRQWRDDQTTGDSTALTMSP